MITPLVITVIKIMLAALTGGTADIPQTLSQAKAFLAGSDFLDPINTGSNPSFFPIGHYVLAAACLLFSQATQWPFAFVLKIPAILADLGVAFLLRTLPQGGDRTALFYLLNPLTWLLSVYHGQFHTVAMALALAALVNMEPHLGNPGLSSGKISQPHLRVGACLLGLAASIRQHYAVFLIPVLLRAKNSRWPILVIFTLTVAVLNIPLYSSQHPERLLTPTWTYGSWGYTIFLLQGPRLLALLGIEAVTVLTNPINHILQSYGSSVYWLWTIVFGLWAFYRRAPVWQAALFFLLGLYAVSPGFGVQWLVWVVPFWLLIHPRQAIIYSMLAALFVMGSYWQAGLNAQYNVVSITANLHLLGPIDLVGVFLVGTFGVITWAYCVQAAWRLAKSSSYPSLS